MKLLFINITFMLFILSQFSSAAVAGEINFSDPYIKGRYSESELLVSIKNYPLGYRSQDKLSTFHHPTSAVIKLPYAAMTLWKIDEGEVDTGQVEKLMNSECMSPNGKVFSWFYWRNYSVLKTHLGDTPPKTHPIIIDKIHNYDRNYLKTKVLKLLNSAKISRNEAVLICALIN